MIRSGPVDFDVRHVTRYDYGDAIAMSQHLLHLTPPQSTRWQVCHEARIDVAPESDETWAGLDYFGNQTRVVNVNRAHDTFTVDAFSSVTLMPRPRLAELGGSPVWSDVAALLREPRAFNGNLARHFLFASPHVDLFPGLDQLTAPSFTPGRSLIEASHALMSQIYREFSFDPRATDVSTPVEDIVRLKRGVCQDFAHLMIACLRRRGLAARYMSGYIQTHRLDSDREMTGADASHAWVSVWCPVHGWVDLDPTNDLLVDREHITVAIGRDFSDVSPVRGVVLGAGGDPDVAVTVSRRD